MVEYRESTRATAGPPLLPERYGLLRDHFGWTCRAHSFDQNVDAASYLDKLQTVLWPFAMRRRLTFHQGGAPVHYTAGDVRGWTNISPMDRPAWTIGMASAIYRPGALGFLVGLSEGCDVQDTPLYPPRVSQPNRAML